MTSERETLRIALDVISEHIRLGIITEQQAREAMVRIGPEGTRYILELIPGSDLAEIAIQYINDLRRHGHTGV